MLTIDEIDMSLTVFSCILTGVSIVATVVSIIYSIKSAKSAKEAESYKDKAKAAIGMVDIEKLAIEYDYERNKFVNATRNEDWYKGIDPNTVISPFSDVLSKFSKIYPILGNSNKLEELVSSVYRDIQNYATASSYEKRVITGNAFKISSELHKYFKEAVDKL